MTIGMFDLDHHQPGAAATPDTATTEPGPPPAQASLSIGQLQAALRLAKAGPAADLSARDYTPEHIGKAELPIRRKKRRRKMTGDTPQGSPADAQRAKESPASGVGGTVVRLFGGRQLSANLAARRVRRQTVTTPELHPQRASHGDGWLPGVVAAEPWRVRLPRWLVPAAAVVVLLVGALTLVGRVAALFTPAAEAPATDTRPDLAETGTAETIALDFLTWDATAKDARAAALTRWRLPATSADSWDGTGQLTADHAATIALLRTSPSSATATVQVRISTAGLGPRWVLLAVPLTTQAGGIRPTAMPVLVGAPPSGLAGPAVPAGAHDDTELADSTRGTLSKMVTAYGAGDLEFVTAPGAQITGLNGAVTSGTVQAWRVRTSAAGADTTRRDGDLTVVWALPGDAGGVRCAYRVQLTFTDGRWLLAAMNPQIEPLR